MKKLISFILMLVIITISGFAQTKPDTSKNNRKKPVMNKPKPTSAKPKAAKPAKNDNRTTGTGTKADTSDKEASTSNAVRNTGTP